MAEQTPPDDIESFLSKNLTLDLVGLSAAQKGEGSIFLGGSAGEYVTPEDDFDYGKIATVVFRWGDPRAEDVFARLNEHIETPDHRFIAFSPVTVIGNTIWDLTLQDKDWRPEIVYNSDAHYVEIPFTDDHEDKGLQDALSQMGSWGKEVIGKIDSRYVRFGLSMDMGPADGVESVEAVLGIGSVAMEEMREETEKLSREQALEFLKNSIEIAEFGGMDETQLHNHVLQVVYWAAETFGDTSTQEDAHLYPDEIGIDGENLPEVLKSVLMRLWQNEIRFGGSNTIDLKAKHVGIETDPIVPRWEEIEQLPSFEERVAFVKANQDIIDGIVPTKIEVMPEVKIVFTPGQDDGWELELTVSPLGVTVLPSGDRGKTKPALDFVLATIDKLELLAETSCQLAYLAAKHTSRDIQRYTQEVPSDARHILLRRLSGEEEIPPKRPNSKDIKSNSGNAVKNLLIERVLSDRE